MNPLLAGLGAAATGAGALTAAHLSLLTAGALAFRERLPDGPVPPVSFLILIPAHNEEPVIGRTLQALGACLRPRDTMLVVADRCTDRTAEIARTAGATVLERAADSEPGRGPARQAGLDTARNLTWDAVVMIDADSIVEPGFLDACERALATGARSLQARSEAAIGERLVEQAALASFALQGVTIPRGRERLGCSSRLRGTGMVLRRDVIERFAFRAPASEDLWLGLDLLVAGIRTHHLEGARLRSENVSSWGAASNQKVRNEAGRMSAAREFVGPLLRRPRWARVEAAWYLASPPYAIAIALGCVGAVLGAAGGATAVLVASLTVLALLALDLVLALVAARAPARTWLALAAAPWYVAWKVAVQLRAARTVQRDETWFPPTPREPSTP